MFTADEGVRGGKVIPLKKMADEALEGCDCVKRVYVYKRTGADVSMKSGRDVFLNDVSEILELQCGRVTVFSILKLRGNMWDFINQKQLFFVCYIPCLEVVLVKH